MRHEDLKKFWEAEEAEWKRLGIWRPMADMAMMVEEIKKEMDDLYEQIRKDMKVEVKAEVEQLIKDRMVKVEVGLLGTGSIACN